MKTKGWISILIFIVLTPNVMAESLPIHDPTQPPASLFEIPPSKDGYSLNSILISPQRKLAIINGEILNPGDTVDDAKVLDIQDNLVVLQRKDKTITLYLLKENIRQE